MILLALSLVPAVGEMAKVRLNDGTMMRGDAELTESEVLIRNEAGVVRCPRERVEQVEWLEPAKTVQSNYMRRFWALAPEDVEGHAALAAWLAGQKAYELARRQCAYVLKLRPEHPAATRLLQEVEKALADAAGEQPVGEGGAKQGEGVGPGAEEKGEPSPPKYKEVPAPPPLSASDILKLKLSEIALDGPPEQLNVRFHRQRTARDVEDLVRQEMVNAPDYDPDWERILEYGRPQEKLQVIVKATGLKYADRIELPGDPRVFSTYRRRVLPLVTRSCVRSGCHGGNTAYAFRFPTSSSSSDEFIYTSFALLDAMETAAGPMINRAVPEESGLLRYLLPAGEEREVHPPVENGRVIPPLRGPRDHRYQPLVEWISSLRSPHPDYQLEYEFPDWFRPLLRKPAEPATADEAPAPVIPGEKPAEDEGPPQEPADAPDGGEGEPPDDDGGERP
jgi:hypothetical protein